MERTNLVQFRAPEVLCDALHDGAARRGLRLSDFARLCIAEGLLRVEGKTTLAEAGRADPPQLEAA